MVEVKGAKVLTYNAIYTVEGVAADAIDKAKEEIAYTNEKYTIDSGSFLSMGRSTPFDGMEVYGRILMTIKDGEPVWEEKR